MEKSNYISIKQYLENKGVYPVKDRGYYGLYHSPLRKDTDPSFKVDYGKDLWHDFGTSEGGSIVDLVMKLENCSLAEAFRKLDDSFSFHRNDIAVPTIPTVQEPAIKIQDIIPLTHPALFGYLNERGVNTDIAKRYCPEVHYLIGGKSFFAIGFQNDAGGWELRNRNFKGCNIPKDITTLNNGSDTIMVFEGFIDFLSYLSLKGSPSPTIDTTVLNSVANLKKAIPFLQAHRTVHVFLDNDEAGRKAVEQLRKLLPGSEVVDQSSFYRDHKDLNDYWKARSAVKVSPKAPVKKKSTGRRM